MNQPLRTLQDFRDILAKVDVSGVLPGLTIKVSSDLAFYQKGFSRRKIAAGPCWLQVHGVDPEEGPWSGRKWVLSPHATYSEVVNTAFAAVMAAMEHEVREKFLFRGSRPYSPHLDVDVLCGADRQGYHDTRPDNGSMNPE